jgi:hypothetical protein
MKIELKTPTASIPDMLRKFPDERVITYEDRNALLAIKSFLASMREPVQAGVPTYLFPQDIRLALAQAVNDAVVGLINTKLTGKVDGRRLDPALAAEREAKKRALLDVQGFKGRISALGDTLATFAMLAKRMQLSGTALRQEKLPSMMALVIDAVMDLQLAAKGGAQSFDTDTNEMVQQTLPRFEALVTRWMHIEQLSNEFDPPKSEFFINWQATLRSLSRDATERIRQLKG